MTEGWLGVDHAPRATPHPLPRELPSRGANIFIPNAILRFIMFKVSLLTFFSKKVRVTYAQIFSNRWARLREKQRTMPITAPMPACKISNGSLMIAYSGVLYTNARPSV